MPSNRAGVGDANDHGHGARADRDERIANSGDVRHYRPDENGELKLVETIQIDKYATGDNHAKRRLITADDSPLPDLTQAEAESLALGIVTRQLQRVHAAEKKQLGLSDKDIAALGKLVSVLTSLRREQRASQPDAEIEALKQQLQELNSGKK